MSKNGTAARSSMARTAQMKKHTLHSSAVPNPATTSTPSRPSSTPRHHFFVEPHAIQPPAVQFSPAQAHQISRVLRLTSGDAVVVLDGQGGELDVTLSVEGRTVIGLIAGQSCRCSEPSLHVVLYQAVIRPEHFVWLLQKGTELGVSRFVPLLSARTQQGGAAVFSEARMVRLRTVLREAAEQSRRRVIPALDPPLTFTAALHAVQAATRDQHAAGMLLWENESAQRFSQVARGRVRPDTAAHLLIGPEGGWTSDEVAAAREAGLDVLFMGPRLLRAETAAIIAAAGALTLSGDLM